MPIQPGTDIGRYHILEQLGEGGMAVVYKAYDTRLESEVAVKVIRIGSLPPDSLPRIQKRFQIEAKKMARMTHPNIVKVMDYGDYEGAPYLVMPYLPGGTLKEKLGQLMPVNEAVKILLPITDALGYAHDKGLVHRDIKPSNILITESGKPMLSDFGVAKILENEETLDLTVTGMGVGTPEYMAPEQASGRSFDHRADVYSLGIVFYEMVTGRKPFTADTPMAVIIKQATDPLPSPIFLNPDLPIEAEQVLIKALAKEPGYRFADMGAFAQALENLAAAAMTAARKRTTRTYQKRRVAPREKIAQEKQAQRTENMNSFKAHWLIIPLSIVGVGLIVFAGVKLLGNGEEKSTTEKQIEQAKTEMAAVAATPVPEMTNTPRFKPTPTLKTVQIRESDKDINIKTPYIGIAGMNLIPELAEIQNHNIDQFGVMVLFVEPGTPAEEAGLVGCGDNVSNVSFDGVLVPIGGDVIFAADGYRLNDFKDLVNFLKYYTVVGQTIKLKVLRDGDIIDIDITTDARPDVASGETQWYDEAKEEAQESVDCRWMGVVGLDINKEIAEAMNLSADTKGVLIESVSSNSPAETAGLRGGSKSIEIHGENVVLGGDIIIAINDTKIYKGEQISELIRGNEPGTILLLDIIRDGRIKNIEVTLGICPFE